jgi:hypothetical protein
MSPLLSAAFTISILSLALCPLHSPLSSLLPSVASTALVILWPSVPFKALRPLRRSVPSLALCPPLGLCPLYGLCPLGVCAILLGSILLRSV